MRALIFCLILLLTSPGAALAFLSNSGGGSGDVTGVGDCASGACLDGSSDGGETISLYDGDSHKATLDIPDIAGDITITTPAATCTLLATDGSGAALTGIDDITFIDTDDNASFYIPIVDGATGSQVMETDGEFSYNPNTNVLIVGSVSATTSLPTTIELGHASDTTIARASAGEITVEGVSVLTTGNVTSADIMIDGTPGSDDTWSCVPVKGINAGEAVKQFDVVTLAADGKWDMANADNAAEIPYGIAVYEGGDGWPAADGEELYVCAISAPGSIRNDGWNTGASAGEDVFLSKTDGLFDQASDIDLDDGEVWTKIGVMQSVGDPDILILGVPDGVTDDGT